MKSLPKTLKAKSRRIFITENQVNFFQIFSLTQNKKDGSIYISWPHIESSNFILFDDHNNISTPDMYSSIGNGKISFHGSGQVHYKTYLNTDNQHFKVDGNILLRELEKKVGARHLLTTLITRPDIEPLDSPALNRQTDYVIEARIIQPTTFIFFAIPQTAEGLQINLQLSLPIEYMDNIPGDILGSGIIPMQKHDILFLAYKTKYLNSFPESSYVSYTDGLLIPFFVGQINNQIEVKMLTPIYTLYGNNFGIEFTVE
jgi:hypothetical protein